MVTIYNFICNQQLEEDGEDGNEDEDDLQLIGGGVDIDDDKAEKNEGLDEDNEIRSDHRRDVGPVFGRACLSWSFPARS